MMEIWRKNYDPASRRTKDEFPYVTAMNSSRIRKPDSIIQFMRNPMRLAARGLISFRDPSILQHASIHTQNLAIVCSDIPIRLLFRSFQRPRGYHGEFSGLASNMDCGGTRRWRSVEGTPQDWIATIDR